MNNEQLLIITKDMPCKVIEIGGRPYLERYFAGYTANGGQFWFHHFLTADAERHLHNHPFVSTSTILCGAYKEQLREISGDPRTPAQDRIRYFKAGDVNQIHRMTLHRIAAIEPDTWTMMYVEPGRCDTWKFIDDDGNEVIMRASPEDWHRNYPPRSKAA